MATMVHMKRQTNKQIRTTKEEIVTAPDNIEQFLQELQFLCNKYNLSVKPNIEGGFIFGKRTDFKDITVDNCYIKDTLLK